MDKKWGMKLVVGSNDTSIKAGMGPNEGDKLSCCGQLKTDALKKRSSDTNIKRYCWYKKG